MKKSESEMKAMGFKLKDLFKIDSDKQYVIFGGELQDLYCLGFTDGANDSIGEPVPVLIKELEDGDA